MNLLWYILLACLGGWILQRLKVPGGVMVGAALACALGNIFFELGSIPPFIKIAAQILTGVYIGINVEVSELKNLKNITKPLIVVIVGLFITNVVTGFLICMTSPLDLITSMLAAAAGGVANMPLIASDMNGDPAMVAIFQCVRMIVGIGVFPSMIAYIGNHIDYKNPMKESVKNTSKVVLEVRKFKKVDVRGLLAAVLVGTAAGWLGNYLQIPSGYLIISLLACIILKVICKHIYAPVEFRKFTQLLSGIYIGTCFNQENVSMLKNLFIPLVIMIVLFIINFIISGLIIYKKHYFGITESLLASTPAGASDMALVTADLGIQNTYLNLLHVIRLLFVISLFPILLSWIAQMF